MGIYARVVYERLDAEETAKGKKEAVYMLRHFPVKHLSRLLEP
jgi:hypothetical protein